MANHDPLRLDASFERDARLHDGRPVRLRWIRAADADLLREGFARLSQQSRRTRFFIPVRELSDEMVRRMTQVDGYDHGALVALSVPDAASGERERGLGVARFVRSLEDRSSAEIAVTVIDEVQGLGLGHLLLSTIAVAAHERGIETFTMDVLSENTRVKSMLWNLHADWKQREGDVSTYAVATARIEGASLGGWPDAA